LNGRHTRSWLAADGTAATTQPLGWGFRAAEQPLVCRPLKGRHASSRLASRRTAQTNPAHPDPPTRNAHPGSPGPIDPTTPPGPQCSTAFNADASKTAPSTPSPTRVALPHSETRPVHT
jgi:hypothetical protein